VTGGSVGSTGGAAGGSTGGSTGSGVDGGTPAAPTTDGGAPPPTPVAGDAPYGCTGCQRLFDGTTLNGWVTANNAWVVKEGALASTGVAADLYTKEDFGDYRIFFQVRQVSGGAKPHKPCTVLFGKHPADETKAQRGLNGAQFQPPNGASWDYGIGGKFTHPTNPNFDVTKWHQCEVLVKEAGSFRAACCPVGATPCKAVEVLDWTGPGRKAPFDIMMHNDGLMDEYKEIWVDRAPTGMDLLSTK
jgi:hypothetical protein